MYLLKVYFNVHSDCLVLLGKVLQLIRGGGLNLASEKNIVKLVP